MGDLVPLAEVRLPFGHGDHDLAAHDLSLDVRVGVVFPGVVVPVLAAGLVRRHLLQPAVIVLVEARLVVVDEDRGGEVPWICDACTITTIIWLRLWLSPMAERDCWTYLQEGHEYR